MNRKGDGGWWLTILRPTVVGPFLPYYLIHARDKLKAPVWPFAKSGVRRCMAKGESKMPENNKKYIWCARVNQTVWVTNHSVLVVLGLNYRFDFWCMVGLVDVSFFSGGIFLVLGSDPLRVVSHGLVGFFEIKGLWLVLFFLFIVFDEVCAL